MVGGSSLPFSSLFYTPTEMEASISTSSSLTLNGPRLSHLSIRSSSQQQRVRFRNPRSFLAAIVSVRAPPPLSCSPSSAPTPSSTENPGEAVTNSSSSGGDGFDGNGGNGKFLSGGGGGGGGGEEEAREDIESLARLDVMKKEEEEESGGQLGYLMRMFPTFRERMLADPSFFLKLLIEVAIDSSCATIGELQKTGNDILAEFQQFAADLLLGNASLLDKLAPYVPSGRLAFAALPRRALGVEWSGSGFPLDQKLYDYLFKVLMDGASKAAWSACKYSVKRIIGTRFSKGVMLGFGCVIVGQGAANLIRAANMQPNLMSAALLGSVFFVGVNQIIYELKEGSPMAEKVPLVAIDEIIPPVPKAKRYPPVSMTLMARLQFANHAYEVIQYGRPGLNGVWCGNTQSFLTAGLFLTFRVD